MSAARWSAVLALVLAGAALTPSAAGAVEVEPPPALCSTLPRNGDAVVDLTVPGDLVADTFHGGPCVLVNVVVEGDVVVPHDSSFHAVLATVRGSVDARGGVAITERSTVGGDVVVDDEHVWRALEVRDSTVTGDVRGRTAGARIVRSTVSGAYDVATTTRAQLARTSVAGPVDTRGGRLLVHDATLGASLTSTGSGEVLVCRTSVVGDLTVTDVRGYVRLGVEADERCRTTVGGSVLLVDNPHSLDLGDLAVAGDLVCTGNTGPRGITTSPLTTVTGARSGQCA
ncbi:hypothetical protein [Cellulomonas cellasea]|uniref:Adhesin domain-containing protein n=1 Tax=Cellulomonas cellasea TaxID=43670 RepID=A0A7W4YAX3_9CELL|nr:hypothetical protein [Cellulomonas cellasea]MBB2923260.1 hypothetical protein [Cellulomonas cellasea]